MPIERFLVYLSLQRFNNDNDDMMKETIFKHIAQIKGELPSSLSEAANPLFLCF